MFFTLLSAFLIYGSEFRVRVRVRGGEVITIRSNAFARLNSAGGGRVHETLEHDPRLDIDTLSTRYIMQ
jgi:hypothetical protein